MKKKIDALFSRIYRSLFLSIAIALALMIPVRVYTEFAASGDVLAACAILVKSTFTASGAFVLGQWLATLLERVLQPSRAQ